MGTDCLFDGDVAQLSCLVPLFERIVSLVAAFAALVFFIMLVVGGFRLLFSAGNAKSAEAAKGTLTAAVLGLLLIVGSYVILRLISAFTGFNLTTFSIPQF